MTLSLIPRPMHLVERSEGLRLGDLRAVVHAPALASVAHALAARLAAGAGVRLPVLADRADAVRAPSIRLTLEPALTAEAYRLRVSPDGVDIDAGSAAGAHHATQTLLQLLPAEVYRHSPIRPDAAEWRMPGVDIDDAPRFSWRGLMLDVARHFMPLPALLRVIDLMALHRMNVLHLHLSDDQGWRVQIQRYPRLTEVGGWRSESQIGPPPSTRFNGRPHGGWYTRDDIREIVAFAGERHITVVPEIDLPGHTGAALAAYPQLGVTRHERAVSTAWGVNGDVVNTEESTVSFFCDVLDEIMELFPSPIIGIGGDECPLDAWRSDARTQQLMRERGLENEHGLASWFTGRIAAHLLAHGRRPYGWDELLEGEPPAETVIASWRGMTGARTAVQRGYGVVACPDDQVYLDYRQSDRPDEPIAFGVPLTLADIYAFEPIPPGVSTDQAALVLGGQANVWTEHMDSPRVVDFYMFPRLCALAEALWSHGDRRFEDFERRLTIHLRRLDALGVEYRPASGPHPWQRRPDVVTQPSTREQHADLIAGLVAGISPD